MANGFPMDGGHVAAGDGAASRSSSSSSPAPRLIVVEDHADTLVLMGRLLSMVPVDGVPAATCAAARAAARAVGRFDVVIADVTLPDGDGLELLAELKSTYGCRTVALSGYDAPAEGLPAGVDLWISKPVNVAELRRAVLTRG
jgi:DNA-binding response OmpR family regulator